MGPAFSMAQALNTWALKAASQLAVSRCLHLVDSTEEVFITC